MFLIFHNVKYVRTAQNKSFHLTVWKNQILVLGKFLELAETFYGEQ